MRVATIQVFDEIVSGSGPWYSRSEFHQRLGVADFFAIQAVTTGVSGSTPTLTIQSEHSPDSENWTAVGSAEISDDFVEDGSLVGYQNANVFAPNVRLKITMGGSSPKCRLILYATLRSRAAGFAR